MWDYTTGKAVGSSPAVVNGVVYVGSDNDCVYAFGSPQTIHINADGSITPTGAPIVTSDNITYNFADDIIYPASFGIVVERNSIVIDGNGYTLQGNQSGNGLTLTGVSNVTIENVSVENFEWGISLELSSYNNVTGNNVAANSSYGIVLESSSNDNIVSGNNVVGSGVGIWLEDSSNNSIGENKVNDFNGIWLSSSSSNSISGDNITESYYGIWLSSSSGNNVTGNNITNNVTTSYYYDIWLSSSSGNNVTGNNITNNVMGNYYGDGVWIYSSAGNSISGNNVTNNGDGIEFSSASSNSINGNNITNNSNGIYLDSSSSNSISGNTFADDGLFVFNSYQNSVQNNTVNDMQLVYLEGDASISVSDAGQVIMVGCDNMTVENLNLSGATVGVELWETNSSIISGNNITANGISGIYLYSSFSNEIYHNNFINNTNQVSSDGSPNIWNDTYAGNYWSDYRTKYQGEIEIGSLGIWNASYEIDENNRDYSPLIHPNGWEALEGLVSCSKTVVGQDYNVNINITVANIGNSPETFNVTAYADATIYIGSENVTLSPVNLTTITFTWNTTDFAYGNYDVSAYTWPVPGESCTCVNVTVTIPGDVNGICKVNMGDVISILYAFGSSPGKPNWNPNCDIDNEGRVDMTDIMIALYNFGQHYS